MNGIVGVQGDGKGSLAIQHILEKGVDRFPSAVDGNILCGFSLPERFGCGADEGAMWGHVDFLETEFLSETPNHMHIEYEPGYLLWDTR